MSGRRPVHLDTDIGGDFDDANALTFLMGTPHVRLVAVTTVGAGGDARRRAEVAAHLLEAGGHGTVPVSAGSDDPLLENPILRDLNPRWILNAYDASMASEQITSDHAAEAIVRSAATYGADLTVLAIGCLTNLATAIRRDPRVMASIGQIVLMGGAFDEQRREANIALDPEAADVVFRSGIPVRAVGHELSRQVQVPIDVHQHEGLDGSELGRRLRRLARRYGEAYATDTITLYDVTAAAAVTDPELFQFRRVTLAVELHGTHTRGMTIVENDPHFDCVTDGSSIEIATDADLDMVRSLFTSRVLQGRWP